MKNQDTIVMSKPTDATQTVDVALDAITPQMLPLQFDRYTLVALLGEGGMARVFRAELVGPSGFIKPVALKFLKSETGHVSLHEQLHLTREACLVGQLKHRNLVDVYELGEQRGQPFICMELVEGYTLAGLIRMRGPLPAPVILEIAIAVAEGLECAHAMKSKQSTSGLVHCDLKPSNILVSHHGDIKVADFGIAIPMAELQGGFEQSFGTLFYMSPEQMTGGVLDLRTDVFSLCMVIATSVLGYNPAQRHASGDALDTGLNPKLNDDDIRAINAAAPGLATIVTTGLSVAPDNRQANMTELIAELRQLQETIPRGERLVHWLATTNEDTRPLASDTVDLNKTTEGPSSLTPPQTHRKSSNLPKEQDIFCGRQQELDELTLLLADGHRLITIHGPGGAGKTRVSQQMGRKAAASTQRPCWFVDITDATDLAGIMLQTAGVLRVKLTDLTAAQALETLGTAMAGQGAALFIFDNCEQAVADAALAMSTWLQHAPEAVFLVTTREPLNIQGEHIFPLAPLPELDGVDLFVARARAAGAPWPDNQENRTVIRQLVTKLDGLPLAIELAAARSRMMSPTQMLTRLNDRFSVLRGGRRDQPARQQTLERLIDWSWQLLTPWEQSALMQLSVFQGGFTVQAAEAVLDLSVWPEAGWVMDVVGSLLDKSLVYATDEGQHARFNLLVSVSDFAQKRWADTDHSGVSSVQNRHAEYFATMGRGEQLATLFGRQTRRVRSLYALELQNCIAGFEWAMASHHLDVAAQCAFSAVHVIRFRGSYEQGSRMLARLLKCEELAAVTRGRTLFHQAMLWKQQSLTEEASAALSSAAELFEAANKPLLTAFSLIEWGEMLQRERRFQEAVETFELSLALAKQEDHHGLIARCLVWGSYSVRQLGESDRADRMLDQSMVSAKRSGNPQAEFLVFLQRGNVATDPHQQEKWFREAIRVNEQRIGSRQNGLRVWNNLALLYGAWGRAEEAVEVFESARQSAQQLGLRYQYALTTGNLGMYLLCLNRLQQAESCLKESIALCQSLGSGLWHRFLVSLSGSLSEQGRWQEGIDALEAFDSSQVEEPDMWQALVCFQRGICQLGLEERSLAQTSLRAGNQLIGPPADGTPGEREWGHPRWYQRRLHDMLQPNNED